MKLKDDCRVKVNIRVFCQRAGPPLQTQAPRLQFCPKAGLPPQTRGTRIAVLLRMNRCGGFLLLSTPHSLFSIWTDLKRTEKIPGAPSWGWWEWIWLTGPFELHRNSPQGLNISSIRVFDQIRDPKIPITLRPRYKYKSYCKNSSCYWEYEKLKFKMRLL